jgi:hypothetical protein
VALFLQENESPEVITARFGGTSPASYGIAAADAEDLPYVVVTRGRHIRLYSAGRDGGVGRKGRSETYIEANLALLPADRAGYLPLLFGANALRTGGTFDEILEASRDYAADLGGRLRERVYNDVVPGLARALAARWHGARGPSIDDLRDIYRQTLYVIFRLLFVAYAEDKDLVPYRTNDRYRARSLKTLARELADAAEKGHLRHDAASVDLWERARALWNAIDRGNRGWDVPEYNGGLFSSDPATSAIGAALARVTLNDSEFGPPLFSLVVDSTGERMHGPVDFRSLSVREFGTIYEGLLESELSVAGIDLALDDARNYVPANGRGEAVVKAGSIYLHNRSGARKATGSYFTKPFVVERVLRDALDPALTTHVARLDALVDAGREADAADAFFDFRCADIAMGSGHFLVAAVDHIEAALASFLARHPLPAIMAELERLRHRALESLGPIAATVEIETASLLRRQVARRCVYGVDVNDIAVELARLSLWIHTFVPGLPLSFLNHSLVVGNSLTGVGRLEDVRSVLDLESRDGQTQTFVSLAISNALEAARKDLARLAMVSDADAGELAQARSASVEALRSAGPAIRLMNLAVAVRFGTVDAPTIYTAEELENIEWGPVREVAESFTAFHFPAAFPEVFVRSDAGFNVIIGNPPWDQVLYEPQQFWVTRSPGLNSLRPERREADIARLRKERPVDAALEKEEEARRERFQQLIRTSFVLQGRGHYEYAKLFAERALSLVSRSGRLGYVLPGNSLLLGGWSEIRRAALTDTSTTIVEARNRGGWLFDDVDHRIPVALLCRGGVAQEADGVIAICPGVTSRERLDAEAVLVLRESELDELSDSRVVPWFNSPRDVGVFDAMRRRPSLSSGKGWLTGTHDARWDFRGTGRHHTLSSTNARAGSWSILMTRHVGQFSIDRTTPVQRYVPEPTALVRPRSGVTGSAGGVILGAEHPFVIFRHPSRNDDARTLIATALPVAGWIHNTGYVHAVRHSAESSPDKLLALLAFMNTYTCDWWVRRFVDRHVSAPVINRLPLPDWSAHQIKTASNIASDMLLRRGSEQLAGSILLDRSSATSRADDEVLAELESLALVGFGLHREHLEVILEDFSDRGCPANRRALLLKGAPL